MTKNTPKNEVITPEGKIAEIQRDIIVVEKQSQKMAVVKSEADYKKATEFLGQVKGRFDRVEQLRLFFVKEPTQHIAKINKMFREQKEPLTAMMENVKSAAGSYRMAEERKAQKEEDRLQKIRDAKNKRNEEKGKAPDLTPAPIVERAETVVKSESGKTTTVKVWKSEIEDIQRLPLEYRKSILDLALQRGLADTVIREAVKNGVREISGVRIFEDIEVRVSSKI